MWVVRQCVQTQDRTMDRDQHASSSRSHGETRPSILGPGRTVYGMCNAGLGSLWVGQHQSTLLNACSQSGTQSQAAFGVGGLSFAKMHTVGKSNVLSWV